MSFNSLKKFSKSIQKSLPKSLPKSLSNNSIENPLTNAKHFFLQNIMIILVVFFSLVISAIFLSVFNISFKEKEYVSGDAYIMEGMVKMKQEPVNRPGLMEQAKKHTLKKRCKTLDKGEMCLKNKDLEKCNELDCCAWVNYKTGAKCMHGSTSGPSVKQNKLGYDYYYYKNKKYDA